MALRFISRWIGKVVTWRQDDILMLLGWLLLQALIGVILADMQYAGVGLHQSCVSPENMRMWAILLFALDFLYVLSVVPPRLAILSLYISTFSVYRVTKIICYTTAAVIITNMIACIVISCIICRPIQRLWDPTVAGYCLDINSVYRAVRIVNIVTDVVTLVVPVPHVLRLQAKRAFKLGVLFTFLLGNIGLIAAIVSLSNISGTSAVADNTWSAAKLLMWGVVEAGTYLIAACLVSYVPLTKWIWAGFRGVYTDRTRNAQIRLQTQPSWETGRSREQLRPGEYDRYPGYGGRENRASVKIAVKRDFVVESA
ncbi:uncharacterized protein BDV14DRAFT_197696 [Aspergillus stella-maris]|uniref:uncharacterized protein n=1 Tax=Aspergillus stella-maris TaxID=1810926 RepID=UPI003CCDE01C